MAQFETGDGIQIEFENDAVEPLDTYRNDEDETIIECQIFIIEATSDDKPIICYDSGRELINQARVQDGLATEEPWNTVEDRVYIRCRGAYGHVRYNLATHDWEYISPRESEYHPME